MRFSKSPSERATVSTARIIRDLPEAKRKNPTEEASLIRLSPNHAADGFALLLTKGQVQALPHDAYVVGPEHLTMLDNAGIDYEVISE